MNTSKQIANNVIWKYLELFSVMGIQLLCTFIMARFLTPEDYGILGMALVFSALAEVFINSGFGQALIREKEVTRLDYSTILYFNIVISVALYILLYFLSDLIAKFYEQPILVDVCKVTFLVLPLNALSIVQMTKLQREIRFKKLFFIFFTSSFMSAAIAIYIAYLYHNVWALVIQVVLTVFIRCILLWITADFFPVFSFSITAFNKYFKFSKNILVSGLIGTLFSNIYSLIIGKAYSATQLGYYSQASKICNLASHTTTQVVQTVTYPILSNLNNKGDDIKEGYKKIISVTLIIVGFVMAMLMSCAQDFFELFMGNSVWRVAGTYLFLIGINGILYPLHAINQNILMVKGNSKTILNLEFARRSIMIVILIITINFNIEIFVAGLSLYSIILLFFNLYYCGKPINYTVKQQLQDTMPIFIRIAIMIFVAKLFVKLIPSQFLVVRIIFSIFICALSGLIIFWKQKDFKNLCVILKSYIRRK